MVPHLTTALSGPLLELERRFLEASPQIEQWLRGQWQEYTPPFYSSVDLRNSGFKLAPVDTNLFPGGFNNLNPAFLPLCVQAAMSAIEKFCPEARRLLLIPENHTRNQFYLQNVAQIAAVLKQTGLEVRIGSLIPDLDGPTTVDLANGQKLLLEPLRRQGNRIGVDGFEPCAILLNNDLSAGIPELLRDLDEQYVLPPLHAGWAVRRKSNHFAAYDQVANDFAREIGIDPWRINPAFSVCRSINFHERQGEECLVANVSAVLDIVREKYREYGITETPYVVVKADAGTYGMGVMTVRDADELIALNRKQRNKMSVVKEGLEVSEVLIQEGVHSFETVHEAVAEPVVYMIDRYVVGGFYRVHTGRGKDENLNAPGMHFEPLAFETGCNLPDYRCGNPDSPPNRFYAYGVVARLACLAAAVELANTRLDP
ncbi:glutamate--cysteine ligase [Azonexus fungiphilus]|jgi:glutamate--cysteine ligase|uniref:Glutamate--cysteine ligase n=1 Tax=Azonexus fungiphilus TaxID=146940 RepID=A0A495VQB9_9RHOO|nr:glutamate--cysteine ligase [Azonexus fungiphilus]NHC06703.1 glutamate--cysteine ligase [Azonexus fungiphilus]RKT51130.1 glutamate--cysteine ligase [Azonexus fungiphilus]